MKLVVLQLDNLVGGCVHLVLTMQLVDGLAGFPAPAVAAMSLLAGLGAHYLRSVEFLPWHVPRPPFDTPPSFPCRTRCPPQTQMRTPLALAT